MRTYELVLVLRPTLKEADRIKLLETVKGWLDKVKVAKENDWGQKALAYPIKKEEAGHYYMWELEAEDPKVLAKEKHIAGGLPADFEQRIIRNDSIIRHLVMRTK